METLNISIWVLGMLVLLALVLMRPRVLAQLDWGLLLVFVLMFIDLRLLAGLGVVRHAMLGLGLDQATHLYLAGIAASPHFRESARSADAVSVSPRQR